MPSGKKTLTPISKRKVERLLLAGLGESSSFDVLKVKQKGSHRVRMPIQKAKGRQSNPNISSLPSWSACEIDIMKEIGFKRIHVAKVDGRFKCSSSREAPTKGECEEKQYSIV